MEKVAPKAVTEDKPPGAVGVGSAAGGPDLYVAHRHEHFPMLHVREARVEDTDDLMPIFMQSSETGVDHQYGKCYYVSVSTSYSYI